MSPEILSTQRRVVWLVFIFLLIGHIMLFSATGVLGIQRHSSEFYFLSRQFIGALLGIALMGLISNVRYQFWGRIAYLIIAAQIALVGLTYIPGIGHQASGATRWIKLGPLLFQPSELAKISVSIYLAALLALHKRQGVSPKKWIFSLVPVLILLALILKQPDLGTTALLCVMMLGMLFLAGARPVYLVSFIGVGGVAMLVSMLLTDYRRKRLFTFLNPWIDPQGAGFQSIQSFLSFHSGKALGVGLGNGNSKLFFLPEVHTDFIFALIGEELGFVGAFSLLILFVYFAYLCLKICFKARDHFASFLALGLSLSLILQIAVNVGGVTGVLPLKGLPLPFISWGRSALIVNLAVVGILLNILKQSGILDERQ
jgi:cell division protein FtsW